MPIRARKDIICYKMLTIGWSMNGIGIFTSYQLSPVSLNIPTIATPYNWKFNPFIMHIRNGVVSSGMVHAFTNIDTPTMLCGYHTDNFIVEAIIPKGTLYFISYDKKHICAKEMKYTDKIIKYPGGLHWKNHLINYLKSI